MKLHIDGPPSGWHPWFAWHPVWCDGQRKWVWLEYVERNWFGTYAYIAKEDVV